MLRTTGIYFIILVMILVKCFLPDEKPEIIPFPLQSVSCLLYTSPSPRD